VNAAEVLNMARHAPRNAHNGAVAYRADLEAGVQLRQGNVLNRSLRGCAQLHPLICMNLAVVLLTWQHLTKKVALSQVSRIPV
jgi:hypothetical protein